MTFQIKALSPDQFVPFFDMSAAELSRHLARRQTVLTNPGTPCRISLEDARIGEEVILLQYQHQPNPTPYKASHAIFIRPGVDQAKPSIGQVPALFKHRWISVRMFDEAHMMIDASVVKGHALSKTLEAGFANRDVAYGHLHFAGPGCFAGRVDRV